MNIENFIKLNKNFFLFYLIHNAFALLYNKFITLIIFLKKNVFLSKVLLLYLARGLYIKVI